MSEQATAEPGLRERKKERTRQHIAETAQRLFAERGFEQVTVAEVARAAEVAPATVFNYFPAKEDLFYSRLEAFEERLLTAIRERPAGSDVLDAFAGFLFGQGGVLAFRSPDGEAAATARIAAISRLVTESPALLARERQVFDQYARTLADALAEEVGVKPGDVRCRTVAGALLGLHRALVDHVRELALAGATASEIGRSVRREARRAVAQLRDGLGGFGAR